jgi:hypothetical protein
VPDLFSIISSRTLNCDYNGQNETKSNFVSTNAEPEMEVIPPGIVISVTAVLKNADSSILCSRDPGLKVMDASDSHKKKHLSQITSTETGR